MLSAEGFRNLIGRIARDIVKNNGPTNEILYSSLTQGRVDPAYSSGRPSIIFDGETQASGKQYPYLGSYTPAPNDIVILAKVKGSYVILGKKL